MNTMIHPNRSRVMGRGFAASASVALCVYGAASLTQGLAVPVRASVAQAQLASEFEQRLEHGSSATLTPQAVMVQRRAPNESAGLEPAQGKVRSEPVATTVVQSLARLGVARLGISEVVRSGEATHDRLAGGPIMIRRGDATSPVTIVSAHRDTHFEFIRDLQQDDVVTLQSDVGETERYRVIGFETVRWDRFSYPLDPARPLLALATCYPFGGTEYGGPWRRVAWAEKMES